MENFTVLDNDGQVWDTTEIKRREPPLGQGDPRTQTNRSGRRSGHAVFFVLSMTCPRFS